MTVNITSLAPAVATAAPTSRVFSPANWNIPQSVTVTGSQDANTTGAVTTVRLNAFNINNTDLAVTVTDDD